MNMKYSLLLVLILSNGMHAMGQSRSTSPVSPSSRARATPSPESTSSSPKMLLRKIPESPTFKGLDLDKIVQTAKSYSVDPDINAPTLEQLYTQQLKDDPFFIHHKQMQKKLVTYLKAFDESQSRYINFGESDVEDVDPDEITHQLTESKNNLIGYIAEINQSKEKEQQEFDTRNLVKAPKLKKLGGK